MLISPLYTYHADVTAKSFTKLFSNNDSFIPKRYLRCKYKAIFSAYYVYIYNTKGFLNLKINIQKNILGLVQTHDFFDSEINVP